MKKILFSALMIITVLSLVACSQPIVSASVLQSDKERVASPQVNQDDLATQVNGNSAFAFDLYQALKGTDGNLLYSPYSLSLALAMTYAGARGETETQMADTLHYLLSQDKLHQVLNSLDLELASRGQGAQGTDGQPFRLNIVNAIWGQKDYKFLPQYLDLLAENYGAGLRVLDYIKAPEQSRLTINQWVSDQTEGKIKDLIPQGAIDEATRLVLTNVIYFNAAWEYPFNEQATVNAPFHLLNGSYISVPMMKQTESFGYADGGSYQAVEIPYDGHELSMVVLLPKTGQFNNFEASLNNEQVQSILKNISPAQVALSMPRFKFDSSFSLKDELPAMGMPTAFSDSADFSGMTGNKDLCISDVLHKAFISVDEAGTEAAAASAVIMRLTAMPAEPVTVTIDHPFIFLIRDIQTGTILFVGRIMNPGV